ncbi:unnamed protein product [Ectocarpus sp. 13 AM-2016]
MTFSLYVGTRSLLPREIFDPLGLADGAEVGAIKLWREAEMKHGRVAILAVSFLLLLNGSTFLLHPFFMGPDCIGPAVGHFQEISARFPDLWAFSLLGMALVEYNTITKAYAEPSFVTGECGLRDDYSLGDLGFDPLNLKPTDQAALETMQTKELNNGRLAMICIADMLVQELVNPINILDFLH